MTDALKMRRASDVRVVGLISLAHGSSHFFHLILPPMFPWLKAEFGFNYAELGLLMTIFFVVSCIVQAASGFLVDRIGARPVLFAGVVLLALAALTYSQSNGYAMLVLGAVIAGCGNGVFHPVDYTLINHKISPPNLPYAYSIHGVTGYIGWAAAPAFMVAVASIADWRIAFLSAAVLEALILLTLWVGRARLIDDVHARREESQTSHAQSNPGGAPMSTFGFLKLPVVWLCWIFFFFSMAATTGLQSFAPTALFKIYDIAVSSGNYYLTLMSMGGAGGMLLGGYLATKLKVPERIITICFTVNIVMGLLLATGLIPIELIVIAFIVIGLGLGIAAPSRDLMIRSATPSGSSGRVYGIVYSGIDLGAAMSPLIFGIFLDIGLPKLLFVGVALLQLMIILTGFKVASIGKPSTA
ncbi:MULTISPECIES: MFS transporter [unclassified Polynucleobacter]|jgi:MFS family permease|uniref:MFS transporter n=1 Tax=unclassified Polynucleobacter TaxID=2640945 RepID=UPI000BCE9637|nr:MULTISPECIES: MFS transporter [unclassified Polynucleobacter]OYY21533.1 MAG: MFS transporter [Polynucleobacter sp. 35-46-11]OZA78362.1 MAG: MFS transporter [Polynucleobacter sp. 39-46-10]